MFKARVQKLRNKIKKEKLDAIFISSVSNIEYLTGYSNFSKDEREAYLFIGGDFQYIITDGRYSEAIKREVAHFTLFERGNEKSTEELFKKHKIKKMGIEEDNLTVSEYKVIKKHFKNVKHFAVSNLRSVKENDEIEKIKKACEIGDETFKYILKNIKPGITEKELAFEIEFFIKKNGADISFPPIVAFGKNSSVPHHQTGNAKLEKKDGQFVLIDMGAKVDNYCSDMTRTIFFGEPSSKQREIYRIVLEAQQKGVDFINTAIKNGKEIKAREVDKVVRTFIKLNGFPDIPHSLGHCIGLEVHEDPRLSPNSKEFLKEGMVFSIEPGIYIPDFGSPRSTRVEAGGVRIEDLYVLEKTDVRQITTSPKNMIEV